MYSSALYTRAPLLSTSSTLRLSILTYQCLRMVAFHLILPERGKLLYTLRRSSRARAVQRIEQLR